MGKTAFVLACLALARILGPFHLVHAAPSSQSVSSRREIEALAKVLLTSSPALGFNPSGPGVVGNSAVIRSHTSLPWAGSHVLVASVQRVTPVRASDVDEAVLEEQLSPEEMEKQTVNLLELNPDLNLTVPAPSYTSLCEMAAGAVHDALEAGEKLVEVEFPPFPVTKLEGDVSLSSDDIIRQNLELCLTMLKRMMRIKARSWALTLPDKDERKLANEYYGADVPFPNIKTWSINSGDEEGFNFANVFGSIIKTTEIKVVPAEFADCYVFVAFSLSEIPAIEEIHKLDPNKPKVLFNLELDKKRADLGTPGLPTRAFHNEFLSKVLPVFYLRFRGYALNLLESPFILAYQGNLFRRYPEPWQSILDKIKDKGLRVVKAETMRPNLGQFKGALTKGLKLQSETARRLADDRAERNFNESVWWEDDKDEAAVSDKWRS